MHMRLAIRWALLVGLAAVGMLGCSRLEPSIKIERQIVIPQFRGEPYFIAAAPNGDLVVGGSNGQVLRLTSAGTIRWSYTRPERYSNMRMGSASMNEFAGGVPLANGNLLLCGTADIPNPAYPGHVRTVGLIAILADNGATVREEYFIPNNDAQYFISRSHRCFAWSGGVGVTGSSTNGNGGVGWLLRFDREGVREWTVVGEQGIGTLGYGAGDVIEAQDGGLYYVTQPGGSRGKSIVAHVTSTGTIDRQATIDRANAIILRSSAPTPRPQIVMGPDDWARDKAGVLVADDQLRTKEKSIRMPPMSFMPAYHRGGGYSLSDGAYLLFGGGANLRALIAVAGAAGDGFRTLEVAGAGMSAISVNDAVEIGPGQFVSVHYQTGSATVDGQRSGQFDAQHSGAVLSWIRLR